MRKIFAILFLLNTIMMAGQKQKILNLPNLDKTWLHFGFTVGTNIMDFSIVKADNFFNTTEFNQIYAIENNSDFGFHLGPVSNLRISDYFHLRLLVDLSFGQRNLTYWTVLDTTDINPVISKHVMKISSTYIEFPLLLKYKAMRLNNFSPYLIGGFNPKIDLAAQKKIKDEELPKIRLQRLDLAYEIGTGIDFYLPYFRLSTELKYSVGLRNLMVPDGTQYSEAVQKLNSRIWMISFHFEGSL
ncbi:MAG: porin family protein [Bacteroidales bacterium]